MPYLNGPFASGFFRYYIPSGLFRHMSSLNRRQQPAAHRTWTLAFRSPVKAFTGEILLFYLQDQHGFLTRQPGSAASASQIHGTPVQGDLGTQNLDIQAAVEVFYRLQRLVRYQYFIIGSIGMLGGYVDGHRGFFASLQATRLSCRPSAVPSH